MMVKLKHIDHTLIMMVKHIDHTLIMMVKHIDHTLIMMVKHYFQGRGQFYALILTECIIIAIDAYKDSTYIYINTYINIYIYT